MTFEIEHHNKTITILESLDTDILLKGCAYFGGGTLLSLDFEEYRWSKVLILSRRLVNKAIAIFVLCFLMVGIRHYLEI